MARLMVCLTLPLHLKTLQLISLHLGKLKTTICFLFTLQVEQQANQKWLLTNICTHWDTLSLQNFGKMLLMMVCTLQWQKVAGQNAVGEEFMVNGFLAQQFLFMTTLADLLQQTYCQ